MPNFSIERDLAFLLSDAARLLRTCADQEAEILLIEPAGVVNTGNVTDAEFTAPAGVVI